MPDLGWYGLIFGASSNSFCASSSAFNISSSANFYFKNSLKLTVLSFYSYDWLSFDFILSTNDLIASAF